MGYSAQRVESLFNIQYPDISWAKLGQELLVVVVVGVVVFVLETQEVPLKEVPVAHAAAIRHFSALGIPKSTLAELPASGSQIFEPDGTLAQACFNDSTLAGSASVLMEELRPKEFHV